MVENNYTRLVSVRVPKELLDKINADRRKYGCYREPLSRVIIRAIYAYYTNHLLTTQSE